MTKNEIKTFLRDNNITEDNMNEMWDYCASFPEFGGEIVTKLKKTRIILERLKCTCRKFFIWSI